ncbi:MAG: binary toxin-like calcium binding domain-containing protein, partial [Rhodothermales bacterium]|nr:binary toxin-like calcium binding domain-containing protein [Rhodothermales bacterium]
MPASATHPLRLLGTLALFLLVAAPAAAQDCGDPSDTDCDGVPNTLELEGYRFDVGSGLLESCVPFEEENCYVTDPTSWSSDGDPYSDFQEASGNNMDGTVGFPYNSPLIAAYPVIEVQLDQYTFNSEMTITDSNGQTLNSNTSFTSSVERTEGVSVTAGTEASWPGGVSASVETTASYSETVAYSSETTQGQELNWETATTFDTGDAGTLVLSIRVRNTGGATALNVVPDFTVYLGSEPLATVFPDDDQAIENLAPGDEPPPFIPQEGGADVAITLTFDQLKALQTGAPVTIEVFQIAADIQRWIQGEDGWGCGNEGDATCSWAGFEGQINPRTLRLLVDFGYSGDPDAQPPFAYRRNPYEYRVYTGSPSPLVDPAFTLRDVIRIVQYEVAGSGGSTTIEGRPYPEAWLFTAQVDEDGYSPILEAWDEEGGDLLDLAMPPDAALLMASPDPDDPGPAILEAAFTKGMLEVRVAANAKGSIPIVSAEAHVYQYGSTVTVPLAPSEDGTYWVLDEAAAPLPLPAGAASTTVTFTDLLGGTRESDAV